MANFQQFLSPRELLNYLNQLTLPGTFFADWNVIDGSTYFTVIEDTPFKITTVKSGRRLKEHLDTIVGTLRNVIPKKAGGYFTYYSLTDEILGANNGFAMTIATSQQGLEDDMNNLIAGGVKP